MPLENVGFLEADLSVLTRSVPIRIISGQTGN
jgi:hypothetical protein